MRRIYFLFLVFILVSGCTAQVPGEQSSATPSEFPIQKNETPPKEKQTELIQTNKSDTEGASKINETIPNMPISKPNESVVKINATTNVSVNKTIQINQTTNKFNQPNQTIYTDKFIVANPFDLSQASVISKFRSCVGHDYSGMNSDGKRETKRSMKHYIDAINSLKGTSGQIKVFAPFNGTIMNIEQDFAGFEGKQRGIQVWLSNPNNDGWLFVFFHVDLLSSLKKGSEVKAGELIGYANVDGGENFDITLKKFVFPSFDPSTFDEEKKPESMVEGSANVLTSPFLHMSPEVLKQYQNKGLKVDDFIISKSSRDAKQCECIDESCNFPSNSPQSHPEDWIIIN